MQYDKEIICINKSELACGYVHFTNFNKKMLNIASNTIIYLQP